MIAACLALLCALSAHAAQSGVEGDTVRTAYPASALGASPGVSYQPGILGLALSADRVGACVSAEREGHLDPAGGTLELWLSPKVPLSQMPDFGPILSTVAEPFMQQIANSMLLIVANSGTDSHGQLALGINLSAQETNIVATPPLDWTVGSWHHLAAVWGKGGMAMYVDGVQTMANQYEGGPRNPGSTIGIGGHATPSPLTQPCNFLIDELRISSTRRSVDELAAGIARIRDGQRLEADEGTLLLEHFDGTPLPPLAITPAAPAGIFPAGQPATVHVVAPTVGETDTELSWELTDLTGSPVASGKVTVPLTDLPGQVPAAVTDLDLSQAGSGAMNLRVTATSANGSTSTGATTVWLNAPPYEPLMATESGFGQSACYARDLDEPVFAAQRQMGVKWSRVSFVWREIEPEKGRFDWAKYDEIVRLAAQYGVELVPTFQWEDAIPAWAGTPEAPLANPGDQKLRLPPERIEDWKDYVRAVVSRYHSTVHWWIPWNEPNLTSYLGPERNPAKYVELLKACSEAAREADPDAKILGVSLSLVDMPYYEECFKLGALEYCDAVGSHPYRMGTDPDEASIGLNALLGMTGEHTWLGELTALRALIDKYAGGRQLGIWLDEMGQPTEDDFFYPFVPTTEQTAAVYLARMFAEGLGTRVIDKGLWFAFHGYGSFGLVRDDFTIKPGAIAYRTLAATLAGKQGVPERAQSSDPHAYRFEGDGGAWVCWVASGERELTLADVPPGAEAHDIFGRPVPLTIRDGAATVTATPIPIIVQWTAPPR